MNIFTLIFGDRFAQKVGQTLLKHFDSGEFPKELLHYPDINLLYYEHKLRIAERTKKSADDETFEYLDALLALRRSELEERSEKTDQWPDASFPFRGLKTERKCGILLVEFSAYTAYTSQEGNDFHVRTFQVA